MRPRLRLDDTDYSVYNVDDDDLDEIDEQDIPINDLSDFEEEHISLTERLRERRKNRRKTRKHKKLRVVTMFLSLIIVIVTLGVCIWNGLHMEKAQYLVEQIDDTFTLHESGISDVKKLGNFFTIHDSKSFDWIMKNIKMTPSLKRILFTPDSNGEYKFTGTPIADEKAPTVELKEVQYEESSDPLSYLAVFNVTREDGSVMQYFVKCVYKNEVLIEFHIY